MFHIEEVDLRENNGMFFRQALFNRTNQRNLPVVYIGTQRFNYKELEEHHSRKPQELEQLLRDAGAITGWSKERALVEAQGEDVADTYAKMAGTY